MAFREACDRGNLPVIRILNILKHPLRLKWTNQVLLEAIRTGNLLLLDTLLFRTEEGSAFSAGDLREAFSAVLKMDLDKAAQIFLVRNGYLQPDLSLETWEAKPPLLHQAAVFGSGKVLLSILEYVDINQRDREGRTPLMSAAVAGKADIIDLLLATGADHTLADYDGHTALYHAILHSQKGMDAPLTKYRRNNLRSIRALLSHSQLIESIDVGMEAVYDILAQSAAVLSRPSEVGRCSAMLRRRYPWPEQLDDISSEYTDQQSASCIVDVAPNQPQSLGANDDIYPLTKPFQWIG